MSGVDFADGGSCARAHPTRCARVVRAEPAAGGRPGPPMLVAEIERIARAGGTPLLADERKSWA